jgi:hypothetical protein
LEAFLDTGLSYRWINFMLKSWNILTTLGEILKGPQLGDICRGWGLLPMLWSPQTASEAVRTALNPAVVSKTHLSTLIKWH